MNFNSISIGRGKVERRERTRVNRKRTGIGIM